MFRPNAWLRLGLALLLFVALAILPPAAEARNGFSRAASEVSLAELPPEATQTLVLIKRGGPFPYPWKDGAVFGNFEKRLPAQPRGYYREYTVPTPGSRDRGTRRIIAGEGRTGDPATSGEYYYTEDHYRNFQRIRQP